MRIALVTDYYLPTLGGVQTAVKAHAETLRRAGHEVTIYCPLAEPSHDEGIVALPVSRIFRPDGYPFTWPPARATALLEHSFRERGIELVHTHSEMFAALAGIRAAQRRQLPLVHTMHGRIDVYTAHVLPLPAVTTHLLAALHRRYVPHDGIRIPKDSPYTSRRAARAMWRLMLAQARVSDHVIVPSAHFQSKLLTQGLRTPTSVLSNSLEDSVRAQIGRPQARTLSPGEPLRLAWVGRLSPEKRPQVFADAVRTLRTTAPGRIEAHVYGDGPARVVIERGRAAIHLHGAVPQSEVLNALRGAHAFVSTSHDFDNQPMAMLEAIAAGLPIVFCDPDLAEIVPQGGGFLTASPDAAALAETITTVLAQPEQITQASKAMIEAQDRAFHPAAGLEQVYAAAVAHHRDVSVA